MAPCERGRGDKTNPARGGRVVICAGSAIISDMRVGRTGAVDNIKALLGYRVFGE